VTGVQHARFKTKLTFFCLHKEWFQMIVQSVNRKGFFL
jgi:hypothetical protein